MMNRRSHRVLAGGIAVLALFLLYLFGHFSTTSFQTIDTDLAAYPVVGERVADDFKQYPLVALSDEYSITDTLKDGVEISYGHNSSADAGLEESPDLSKTITETGPTPAESTDSSSGPTTFTSPDLAQTLSLQFPQTLAEPLTITLPNDKIITVTHNTEETYSSEFLTSSPSLPRVTLGREGLDGEEGGSSPSSSANSPTYLKYTSADQRVNTYYAYQKDQAAGYRNLKHWTVFEHGSGEELQSYTFSNAHLSLNDRGEVEVRYFAPLDESMKAEVDDNLWARAQKVLAEDQRSDIENQPVDFIIPAPYTIDAQGRQVTHEWVVTPAAAIDPDDTSGDFVLSVQFEVPLLGYPIALDPTLQFTAPGVSNAGDVITGETTSNHFGRSLTTGDFNADGKDDLAVGASAYNSSQGRTYIFYGGNMSSENATGADVTLTGEATSNYFGYSLTTGDFNADGKDDLAVGASRYNSYQGRTYLFYGGSMVSENATGADVTLTGETTYNFFGWYITTGDFNADGKDDLAVGAQTYNSSQGRVYFYTFNDWVITGEGTDEFFGSSFAVGDFNNDGKNDLAVGAYGWNDNNTGRVYIFYGGQKTPATVSGADVTLTGEATSNSFGISLTTGDFNADGKDDLAVGAYGYNSYQGRAYIFYNDGRYPENAQYADITITGEKTSSNFGDALHAGDLSGNGVDDLIIAASGYDDPNDQGRIYVLMSEAATQYRSGYKFRGTVKLNGTVKFH